MTYYEALVPLDPLNLSPYELSPLELGYLTWNTLEETPLELTNFCELGLDRSLIYV